MRLTFYISLFLLLAGTGQAATHSDAPEAIDFIHYRAVITPDMSQQSLEGEVEIEFMALRAGVRSLQFSSKYKSIHSVTSDALNFESQIKDDKLTISFADALVPHKSYRVRIRYQAKPKRGMRFYSDHMFTVYHTANWLVAHSHLADKSTFSLTLVHDEGLSSVGNGVRVSSEKGTNGRIRTHWLQDQPIPLYTFGFALGQFQRLTKKADNTHFHLLYRPKSGFSPTQIETMFTDVADMKRFFEQKAGFALVNQTYHFVLVEGRMAQEASGFSLVGEEFGKHLLADPQENWFVAHELAHEWWGNSVTCSHFGHFWLNEGLVQFLVAAYKQHRFGQAAYQKEINLAVQRVKRAIGEGRAGPTAYLQPISDNNINRTMTYSKGALIFHALRQQLGEAHFWQALRVYSQQHQGGSVTTNDLKTAFEQVSKQDLSVEFNNWVYGDAVPDIKFDGQAQSSAH